MNADDFPYSYKVKWVRAYPDVAGIPAGSVDSVSVEVLDAGFERILDNLWLRRTVELGVSR